MTTAVAIHRPGMHDLPQHLSRSIACSAKAFVIHIESPSVTRSAILILQPSAALNAPSLAIIGIPSACTSTHDMSPLYVLDRVAAIAVAKFTIWIKSGTALVSGASVTTAATAAAAMAAASVAMMGHFDGRRM